MKMAESSPNGQKKVAEEIAHHKEFLLFLLCFQKTCTALTRINQGLRKDSD